jgi:DNA-binding MarR family transcriptional regulator
MSSIDEHSDTIGGVADRELRLLSEVNRRPQASQRELARRVGVALGMTNLLLHNLAEKGYVRITRAGWRRWLYALTPDGFLRKVQLTLSYVHRFLDHYQKVRQTLREELAVQSLNAESRVAILGTGEFAELVYLGLKDLGIEELDVFAVNGLAGGEFLGMPVREFSALRPDQYDRIVVASLGGTEKQFRSLLASGVAPEKLVTFFNDAKTSLVP